MSDGCWGPDGERLAPYLRRDVVFRCIDRPGTGETTRVGLVTRVHHKDEETNRSGSYAEYDVLLMSHLECFEIKRVPTMGFHLASDSGDYAVLRAASELPDTEDDTMFYQNFMDSDGDLVVVIFIEDRFPMIIGTANHLRSGEDSAPWHTNSSEGEVRVTHHRGADVKMTENGDIIISIDGTQIFRVWDDSGTLKIDLGDASVAERVVLGDTFRDWVNQYTVGVVGGLVHHTHAYENYPGGAGPIDAESSQPKIPTVLQKVLIPGAEIDEMPEAQLTEKVKTQS